MAVPWLPRLSGHLRCLEESEGKGVSRDNKWSLTTLAWVGKGMAVPWSPRLFGLNIGGLLRCLDGLEERAVSRDTCMGRERDGGPLVS